VEKCTKPKRKGGLGIMNLRSQNNALLLKHLDKFYKKEDITWVNLIWNTYYANGGASSSLLIHFRGIASCKVGDGTTVLFWFDVWNEHLLHQQFPRLFSYAKNKDISVA
jgi:hypothetical protein